MENLGDNCESCSTLEGMLDVIVGINLNVADLSLYTEFLGKYGRTLTPLFCEKKSRCIQHHSVSMLSTPDQLKRLVDYCNTNPQDSLVKNIAFIQESDPRDYGVDNPPSTT